MTDLGLMCSAHALRDSFAYFVSNRDEDNVRVYMIDQRNNTFVWVLKIF